MARPRRHPPDPRRGTSPIVDLLFEVAAPPLPGAVCRGRWRLFDEPPPELDPRRAASRRQAALRLCRQCPALTRCQQWVASLPRCQRPSGVVAGQANLDRRNRRTDAKAAPPVRGEGVS